MLEKVAMFTILTSIILVASFSILCLLIMMVIEKAREIAIFKAMGTTTQSIVRIFVIQGAAIGVLGTFIGAILGLGLCYLISSLGLKLPGGIYYIEQIPVMVEPFEVIRNAKMMLPVNKPANTTIPVVELFLNEAL